MSDSLSAAAADTQVLLRELPLKKAEREKMLAVSWKGRVFCFEPNSELGAEALTRWTQPVRLRLRYVDSGYVLEADRV